MDNIRSFSDYLRDSKNTSENTILAYSRDILAFKKYLEKKGKELLEATQTDVLSYIMELSKAGKSTSTTNRKLASIRAFYTFKIKENELKTNPADDIKTPRAERKEVDFLSIAEVEELLKQPGESVKGYRDRAIFEVLYGTGIRVNELIELNLDDVNLRMGFITCQSNGKGRIVPLGSYAKDAIKKYFDSSMPSLAKNKNYQDGSAPLFLNYMGERFTRQGLWKLMKQYGKAV